MTEPYYADDLVQLWYGDCREILPTLAVEPDLIVADPPYRSPHTITRIAHELGLSFDRANAPGLQMATAARVADGRARRAKLALDLLEDAERLRGQLFAETVTFNIGGKDNVYTEHAIPEPTFRDKRDLMHAIGIAVDRAVRLDEYDSGSSLTGVVSLLENLGRGLRERHGTGDDEHPTDPTKDPQ